MTIREEITATFQTQIATGIDSLIEAGLPPAYDISKMSCVQYPDGVRIFAYEGVEFLELHPMEISCDGPEGLTLKARNIYRYLNRPGD